jgi:hypothetical protein
MTPARFFAIMLLIVGSVYPYSRQLHGSVWICRVALLIFAGKVILDYLIAEREHEGDDRIQHQKCLHCGYDMRATLYRCPECGEDVLQQLDEYVPDHLAENRETIESHLVIDTRPTADNMDQR